MLRIESSYSFNEPSPVRSERNVNHWFRVVRHHAVLGDCVTIIKNR